MGLLAGENELEERDAMDWLVDDEMVRQWRGVCKEEEEITVKRSEVKAGK